MFTRHHLKLFAISVGFLVALYALASANAAPPPQKPLRIAVILPLTGAGALSAESFRNGMRMALSDLSDQDRKLLNLSFDDDQMNPRNTISAFRNILARERPDLVVTFTAGVGTALAPVADSAGVTHLAAVSRNTNTCRDRKRCFLMWPAPEDVIALLIDHLRAKKWRKIAWISTMHEGPAMMLRTFESRAGGDFEIVAQDDYAPDSIDFRPFLTRVRAQPKVDAIVVNLFQGQIGNFARQARDLKLEVPRLGLEIHGDSAEWKTAHGAMDGDWFAGTGFRNAEMETRYDREFPGASSYATALAYDLTMILRDAAAARSQDIAQYFSTLPPREGVSGRIVLDEFRRLRVESVARQVPLGTE